MTFRRCLVAATLAGVAVVLFVGIGCRRGAAKQEVVVYTALDRGFSEPILTKFEKDTGIRVKVQYDTEHTKTVGLVNTIRSEKKRPRCDVFWNNEIVNTLRLQKEGLLSPYKAKAAEAFPATFRDPEGHWTGFAGRARVLLVNTDLVKPEDEPKSIYDLADPKWKGKVGIAKPLAGTTASHAACLFEKLGSQKAKAFFASLKANGIQIESGNKGVAVKVGQGKLAFGLTDTDDAIIEVEAGRPVKIVYPDGAADQMGVLFIPNTLAMVKGGPNPEAAKKLIEYLLSPEVEIALARAKSAQIPLNPQVNERVRVKTPKDVKAMEIDFRAAADRFRDAALYIKDEFLN